MGTMNEPHGDALTWGHSPEAEQSVLGGLMLDNKAFDVVAEAFAATA